MNKKEFFISSLVNKFILLFLSILGSLILIELGLRLAGYIILEQQERKNRIAIQQTENIKILCLGESTTALGRNNSYPSQLEKILNTTNPKIHFNVINKGIPSIDTSYVLAQIENNLITYKPNIVVVMIGINDPPEKISEISQSFYSNNSFFKSLRLYKLYKFICFYLKEQLPEENRTGQISFSNQLEIGWQARKNFKYAQAKAAFYKVLKTNPKNSAAYIGLAYTYLDENKFLEAEEILQKGLNLCPNKGELYAALGFVHKANNNLTKAEINFNESLFLNPDQDELYLALGSIYHQQHKYNLAEAAYKKAIEINPKNINSRNAFAWYLYEQIELKKTTDDFKQSNNNIPNIKQTSNELSIENQDFNKNSALKQYYNSRVVKNISYNPITADNFRKINAILVKYKLKFFCMQYPLRNLESLRLLFNDTSNIVFIDNEQTFREALKKSAYSDYFTDMFAGDFGHCSQLGNNLIAQNVAKAILKEYFDK